MRANRGKGRKDAHGLRVAIRVNRHDNLGAADIEARRVEIDTRELVQSSLLRGWMGRHAYTSDCVRMRRNASPVRQKSSLLIGVGRSERRTPPVTTSLLTGNQVAARAQAHHSVFGSEFWRGTIVPEDALVRAVSDVPTYGVSDGWL